MRQIMIGTDPSHEAEVARIAFAAGAAEVSRESTVKLRADGSRRDEVSMVVRLSAPGARALVEGLSHLPEGAWRAVSVHPRSVFSGRPLRDETRPYPVPALEMEEDLWEFAHVTASLILRVMLAAALVAHGMIGGNLPLMIAGLLFLPYHHALLGLALGAVRRRGGLMGQSVLVFVLSTGLIALAAALVALAEGGPMKWEPEGGPVPAILIGSVVGIAAALAASDDAGRRELIGLAATAHLSVLPAWAGIALVLGQTGTMGAKALDFALAVAALTIGAALTFRVTGAAKGVPGRQG